MLAIYSEFAGARGKSLSGINPGSDEFAFSRSDAIELIDLLMKNSVAIVGGDVMKYLDGRLEYVYANWFCSRKELESHAEYVNRSGLLALKYVSDFVAIGGYEPQFVLVQER